MVNTVNYCMNINANPSSVVAKEGFLFLFILFFFGSCKVNTGNGGALLGYTLMAH